MLVQQSTVKGGQPPGFDAIDLLADVCVEKAFEQAPPLDPLACVQHLPVQTPVTFHDSAEATDPVALKWVAFDQSVVRKSSAIGLLLPSKGVGRKSEVLASGGSPRAVVRSESSLRCDRVWRRD